DKNKSDSSVQRGWSCAVRSPVLVSVPALREEVGFERQERISKCPFLSSLFCLLAGCLGRVPSRAGTNIVGLGFNRAWGIWVRYEVNNSKVSILRSCRSC